MRGQIETPVQSCMVPRDGRKLDRIVICAAYQEARKQLSGENDRHSPIASGKPSDSHDEPVSSCSIA
jgi:hypothetical protein